MELIYEDLTHELIGCFFDVHNSLGVGYDERAYHKGLECRLRKKGINYRSEERKILMHRGRKVTEFKADLIAFDKSILELKTPVLGKHFGKLADMTRQLDNSLPNSCRSAE